MLPFHCLSGGERRWLFPLLASNSSFVGSPRCGRLSAAPCPGWAGESCYRLSSVVLCRLCRECARPLLTRAKIYQQQLEPASPFFPLPQFVGLWRVETPLCWHRAVIYEVMPVWLPSWSPAVLVLKHYAHLRLWALLARPLVVHASTVLCAGTQLVGPLIHCASYRRSVLPLHTFPPLLCMLEQVWGPLFCLGS